MAAGRWVLGLGLLGSIGIVLAQNASVSLPLVVLGQPTIALPLGVWVVLASLVGAGTTGILTALFRWSDYLTRRSTKRELRAEGLDGGFPGPAAPASPPPAPAAAPRDAAGEIPREPGRRWPWSAASPPAPSAPPPPPSSPPPAVASSASEVWDDWAGDDRDWDWEEIPLPETPPAPPRQPISAPSQPEPPREVPPAPPATRPSSVYSYSAQQPRNSAVGRAEAVYDAEYRVIIPPYRELVDETMVDAYGDDEYRDEYDDDDRDRPVAPSGYSAADEDDEFDDEAEDADELGDEVFDDWEEEAATKDWL